MTMGEAIVACFKKTFVYRGRARRSEYWYFYLFAALLNIPLGILEALFPEDADIGAIPALILALVFLVATLGVSLPYLSVSVRRIHDLNWSGYWLLTPVILAAASFGYLSFAGEEGFLTPVLTLAFIASILVFFVATMIKGTDGENKYGPDPTDEIPERHVFD